MPFFQLPREIITFIFQNLLRNRSEKKNRLSFNMQTAVFHCVAPILLRDETAGLRYAFLGAK